MWRQFGRGIRPRKMHLPREARCAVKAFTGEDDRLFGAWPGSAAPASVCPPTVSALPHVFAAIVASGLDAAVRLAVFWRHPPVAARVSCVAGLAAAGFSAGPGPASRGADPALAGASCPIRHSQRVESRAVAERGSRLDGLSKADQDDWLVPLVPLVVARPPVWFLRRPTGVAPPAAWRCLHLPAALLVAWLFQRRLVVWIFRQRLAEPLIAGRPPVWPFRRRLVVAPIAPVLPAVLPFQQRLAEQLPAWSFRQRLVVAPIVAVQPAVLPFPPRLAEWLIAGRHPAWPFRQRLVAALLVVVRLVVWIFPQQLAESLVAGRCPAWFFRQRLVVAPIAVAWPSVLPFRQQLAE